MKRTGGHSVRPRNFILPLAAAFLCLCAAAAGQTADTTTYNPVIRGLLDKGMWSTPAYDLLRDLVKAAPHRLSGSKGAATAVAWMTSEMNVLQFDSVRQEAVMVPRWERGKIERADIVGRPSYRLEVCALGGSVPTPRGGLTAEVVEVHSLQEARALGSRGKGKIVFFNRPMDAREVDTFNAYEGAVDQRGEGADAAASVGGVAALVRSVSLRPDRVPHTGAMSYAKDVPEVPAAAISIMDADTLSARLKRTPSLRVRLRLDCRTLPDVPSANVLGEIVGTEKPRDIIVVGGHLDCWDKGEGAVDDGSGCVQALEALRLIKALGLHPKRTIRAVAFMNEENGSRGGKAYAADPARKGEHQVAAIESDRGCFAPTGFSVDCDSALFQRTERWKPFFKELQAGEWSQGFSGVDILPTVRQGVPGFGLVVESQRYFDYHHSDNDLISAVNPRELELGAITEALLCYLIAQEGL